MKRLDNGSYAYLHYVWISPLVTAVAMFFLWHQIGISSLAGLGVILLLCLPAQGISLSAVNS
jgi:hypothetical protein